MASANSTIDETSNIHYKYICDELKQNLDEAVLYLQFKPSYYSERYPNRRKLEAAYHSLTTEQQQKLKAFFEKAAQSSQTVREAETKAKKNYAFQRHSQKPAPLPDFTCPNRDYEPHATQYNQTHANNSIDKIKRCGTVKAINQVIISTFCACEKNATTCARNVYHSILHKCMDLLSKRENKDFSISLKELISLNPIRGSKTGSVCVLLLNICAKTHNSFYVRKLFFGDKNSPSLMKKWGVTPDEKIYCTAVKVCANTKNTRLFNRLFKEMSEAIAHGGSVTANQIMCVELLQYYSAVNDTTAVRELLFGRDGKNSLMGKWAVQEDSSIYSAAITLCTQTRNETLFEEVHEAALKKITEGAIVPDHYFSGALAHYYLKIKNTDACRELILDNEKSRSLIKRWRVKPNINVFNIGFSLCADTRDEILFNELFSLMTAEINDGRIEANEITCVNILGYCENVKNDIATRALVIGRGGEESLMSKWRAEDSECIYGAAFKVCAATLNHQLFELIYHQMLEKAVSNKIRPNESCIVSLLNYYLAAKDDKATEELMLGRGDANSLISQWGEQDSMPIYSAAIKVCTATLNRRLFEEIYQIIRRKITQRKFTANYILCVNLIAYFAAVKDAAAASEFLISTDTQDSLMYQWGIPPDTKICCAAITVCIETQDQTLFNTLYKSILFKIETGQITPGVHLCNRLLCYYADVNDYRAAYQVLFSDAPSYFIRSNDFELTSSFRDVPYTAKESSAPAPFFKASSAPIQKKPLNSASEHPFNAAPHSCVIDSNDSLLKRWNITPDATLLDRAILAYTKLRRPDWVIQALKVLILERNVKPEPASFILLLGHFSQQGDIFAAKTLFFDKITRVTDNPGDITVLPADIRKPVTSAGRIDRDYNRERDANPNLYRLPDKDYAPVFDNTTDAYSPGLMSDCAIKKPTHGYTIAWNIPYDERTCGTFLAFCFKNKQVGLAKRMMQMCEKYKITITPTMQALFAIQEPGDFKAQLRRGIENKIYRANLGLTDGALDFHISAVFRGIKKSEETSSGLPFEFAKQLWFYHLEHLEKDKTITTLITGYHGSTKLREQLLEFADDNGFQIIIDPDNPGRLTIPRRVLLGSNHMKLTSEVLKSLPQRSGSF